MSAAAPAADVCVVGLRGIPEVMGGVEAHCEELYSRLADQEAGRRFIVLARSPYVASRSQVRPNLSVVPLWSPRGRYFEAIAHSALAVLYSRFSLGARVIHIHAIGPGLVTPLAKLLGMKVILTHHGEDYRRQKWNGLAKSVLRLGERIGVTWADRVIVVSRSVTEGLKTRYPSRSERIFFVPNGASIAGLGEDGQEAGSVLARFGLEPGRFILSVGRLVPEKGFHDLIAAHEASGSAHKLVIAGGVEHESDYSRALVERAGEKVVFTGRLGRRELCELYGNAALFVLPSYHEGLPIAALEALACGAPLLLSDIQPNRDVALPEANYFHTGDTGDLARALARPSGAYKVGAEVLRNYDWEQIASDTRSILASLHRPEPKPPRLLFAINSLEGGGAERVMARLVAGLREEMPEAEITLALLDDRPEKHAVPKGVNVVRLDCDGSVSRSIRRLRDLARKAKPDVVVSFLTRANMAAVIAARAAGARCIVSERVHTSSHFGGGMKARANRLAVRLLYPRADRVVAVSHGVACDLAENYRVPWDRLATINNPVDAPAIHAAAEEEPQVGLPDRFILAVGRLVANKNFPMLLKAYAQSGITAHLVILGEGPERADLEDLAQSLGVAGRVHLPGYADNPYPVMRRALCYVSASNAEGFPNAMVEAMVLGKPIVATDCRSGPSEILAERPEGQVEGVLEARHGILVPPGGEAEMTEALRRMMAPVTLQHYAAKSRQRAGDFDTRSIFGRYAEVIAAVRDGR